MRYLVLSDIHANLEALEAVLTTAGDGWDAVLVLGDLVGYGADPNAVVERVRALKDVIVIRGNHDKVGAGLESVAGFNHLARQAILWTTKALTAENRTWVGELPAGPVAVDSAVEICHGSPFDEDLYIFDDLDARRSFGVMQRPLCVFGHTHVPAAFQFDVDLRHMPQPRGPEFPITLYANSRYLVNCGAVGQPRDGDPRAAYGVIDTTGQSITVHRVPYDVGAAQAKIVKAGLPEVLAQRLAIGR
jgi:diadenosine tetraphosphatase ApaH/serine/threonine PP2A family protein phosphatase